MHIANVVHANPKEQGFGLDGIDDSGLSKDLLMTDTCPDHGLHLEVSVINLRIIVVWNDCSVSSKIVHYSM